MSLGERIYRLRAEKNLSQGDLADLLDVSRQSISKWENNAAVPDLEKIIKLSDIFGVSLDELVKGEEKLNVVSENAIISEPQLQKSGFPPRKIAGTILLCMAFLVTLVFLVAGGGLSGLIFALPFLMCGIICFIFKKNVGLWCAWGVCFVVEMYLRFAAGVNTSMILHMFQWEEITMGLIVAWCEFFVIILLIGVTVFRFRNQVAALDKKSRNRIIILWILFVLVQTFIVIRPYVIQNIIQIFSYVLAYFISMGYVYLLAYALIDWIRIGVFTAALVHTIRYVQSKKI